MSTPIDSLAFFDQLADEMNAQPERFAPLGPADMVVAFVVQRPEGDFRARLTFEGIECTGVVALDPAVPVAADFCLQGPLDAWQAMFDDIVTNGRATGRHTINSLALLGTSVRCLGDDPMGLDKFSRFNQTLQEFLDGAARLTVGAGSGG